MPAPSLADYSAYPQRRALEQPASAFPAPLITIVTVTLNAVRTLERTIRSVQGEPGPAIEQIFVDAVSSDGTTDLIRRLARPQDYWISEKDRGISDAFNKGIALARGRYIQILNADDWLSPGQTETAVRILQEAGADFVFGDLVFYDEDRPIFTAVGDPDYARVIHRRMPTVGHPTLLADRSCFERVGLFDLAYRNAMDYDWLYRLHRAGARGVHSPSIIGHMTHAGQSNLQFRRTIEEVKTIAISQGRNPVVATAEARLRQLKTACSLAVKEHARPLYHLVRRLINPSYRPAPAHR
jgi:glycosyltransferase involved in cell wall biosynthesis